MLVGMRTLRIGEENTSPNRNETGGISVAESCALQNLLLAGGPGHLTVLPQMAFKGHERKRKTFQVIPKFSTHLHIFSYTHRIIGLYGCILKIVS